jgi:hypothetical protein
MDVISTKIDVIAGRRAFLSALGFGGAAAAAFATGLGDAGAQTFGGGGGNGLTDQKILNFALNLEYLEAEFYLRAATGQGLPDSEVDGRGNLGPVVGGSKVHFDTMAFAQYAKEIAGDEHAHVLFLRGALGDAKVARPKIDFTHAFTAAARAAGLIGPADRFNAFANETNFLLAAFIFEDVGVTAYKGAARFLENKDYLEAAAGILAVEAYHAGEIRTVLFSLGLIEQAQKISDLRDSVDGASDNDQGIAKKDGLANIVPADDNGLAFSRSPDQVLSIVYLGGNGSGGFFPHGLNGAIK